VPAGPKGQKRPTDAIGDAAGQEADAKDDGKDPAAKALGSKGGKKRAENMSPERRSEIARKAAESRWKK
jgi:hypothetical protein